jgi:RNA polymerase sigma factor (sigma-70 family)
MTGGVGAVDDSPTNEDGEQLLSVAEVFRDHYDGLVRLGFLLTGSREVAEDVVQDAFARAQPRWDGVDRPLPYLRASVVNGCRMHHRRGARERAHFAGLVRADVAPDTPVILDAVGALPFRQRAALVLRFYEDRSDDDIAEVLGCRPATVRSLIHRGLGQLRRVVDRD